MPADAKPCAPSPTPLRLVAPLSTSYASTTRPTLKWEGGDKCGTTIDLCSDSECRDVVQTLAPLQGTFSMRPPTDLPRGVAFWRARSGAEITPIWSVFIAKATAVDSAGGTFSDFNGDGRSDVAVTTENGTIYVYYGAPTGFESSPTALIVDDAKSSFPVGDLAAVGDLSGDGFGDLAVLLPSKNEVQIFFGSRSGLIQQSSATVPVQGDVLRGGLDINGDGYGDVLVQSTAGLFPVFGTNAEPLQGRAFDLPARLGQGTIAICDIDGDGSEDAVVLVSSDAGPVPTVYGTASGHLSPAIAAVASHGLGDEGFLSVTCADLEGDGYPEVIASAKDSAVRGSGLGDVVVFRNVNGALSTSGESLKGLAMYQRSGTRLTQIGDMDGDGMDDLAVGFSADVDSVQVAFAPLSIHADAVEVSGPIGVSLAGAQAAGDFDGDGLADLLVSVLSQDAAFLFRGSRTARVLTPPQIHLDAPAGSASFGDLFSASR